MAKSERCSVKARRSGLWPDAQAVHRSAVTKARAHVSWTAFEQVHQEAVKLAYEVWPTREADTWQGLSVFAIDGSKYQLPAADAVRTAFDPHSGLEHSGKGHYPQCLVSTAYDVFRRLPIARTVQPMAAANEREEVKALLPHIPRGGVLLFDRGYPSYDSARTPAAAVSGLVGAAVSGRRHVCHGRNLRPLRAG